MRLLLTVLMMALSVKAFAGTVVVFETSMGNMEVELNDEKAPITVANFLQYVDEQFYDDTIFHRVIPGFVVQGGGHTADMTEKATHDPIENEAQNGLSNLRGTIAMARTSEPHTASSQFYINHVDNTRLNYRDDEHWGYAVFGQLFSGLETLDAIAGVETTTVGEYENVPAQPVTTRIYRQDSIGTLTALHCSK